MVGGTGGGGVFLALGGLVEVDEGLRLFAEEEGVLLLLLLLSLLLLSLLLLLLLLLLDVSLLSAVTPRGETAFSSLAILLFRTIPTTIRPAMMRKRTTDRIIMGSLGREVFRVLSLAYSEGGGPDWPGYD
jgi:hypothetical protein